MGRGRRRTVGRSFGIGWWRRAPAAAAALVLAAGCDFVRSPEPVGPVEERIMVHAVLRAGSETASVLLTRATADDDPFPWEVRRVSGASVRVTGAAGPGADTIRLDEAPAGFAPCFTSSPREEPDTAERAGAGCYAAVLPGQVRAGRTYGLQVALAGHGPIDGAAGVPHPPEVGAPAPGARIEVADTAHDPFGGAEFIGGFPVAWTTSTGVGAVDVSLTADGVWRGGDGLEDAECSLGYRFGDTADDNSGTTGHPAADSTRLWLYRLLCRVPGDTTAWAPVEDWDSVTARLRVTAFDTAYARFRNEVLHAHGTVSESGASAGLRGAPGVFGAVAAVERRVTFVPAPGTRAAPPP